MSDSVLYRSADAIHPLTGTETHPLGPPRPRLSDAIHPLTGTETIGYLTVTLKSIMMQSTPSRGRKLSFPDAGNAQCRCNPPPHGDGNLEEFGRPFDRVEAGCNPPPHGDGNSCMMDTELPSTGCNPPPHGDGNIVFGLDSLHQFRCNPPPHGDGNFLHA